MKFTSGMPSKLSRLAAVACRRRRPLGLLIACLALLMSAPEAYAGCDSIGWYAPEVVIKLPTTIVVPPNAPDGAVLATTEPVAVVGATAGKKYANCSGGGLIRWSSNGPFGSTTNWTGSTSISGIGYTMSLSGGGAVDGMTLNSTYTVPDGALTFTSQLYVELKLVKTGPITKLGTLTLNGTGGYAITFYVGGTGSMTGLVSVAQVAGSSSISSTACTVTSPSPSVPLDPIKASALTGIGSTAGEKSFPITLNCPSAGTKVFITLTDNANPANTSTTLALKSGSTASGVALQVLNQGTPVAFGPDSSAAGNTNQWQAGTSSGGPMDIPLSARYVQTDAKVKAGTVNGVATFTMSYQ